MIIILADLNKEPKSGYERIRLNTTATTLQPGIYDCDEAGKHEIELANLIGEHIRQRTPEMEILENLLARDDVLKMPIYDQVMYLDENHPDWDDNRKANYLSISPSRVRNRRWECQKNDRQQNNNSDRITRKWNNRDISG